MTTIDRSNELPSDHDPSHDTGHGPHHDEGSYLTPKGGPLVTVWDWCTTVDHKKLGVMYLVAVLF
ncbi:MAG: hypothetical protein AAGK04_14520, partial [Planctomycetota bacterium]